VAILSILPLEELVVALYLPQQVEHPAMVLRMVGITGVLVQPVAYLHSLPSMVHVPKKMRRIQPDSRKVAMVETWRPEHQGLLPPYIKQVLRPKSLQLK
jgi:hypothetical protein